MHVSCSKDWQNIHLYKDRSGVPALRSKRQSFAEASDSKMVYMQRRRRSAYHVPESDDFAPGAAAIDGGSAATVCSKLTLPLEVKADDMFKYYSFNVSERG